jgi:hypothetical protein
MCLCATDVHAQVAQALYDVASIEVEIGRELDKAMGRFQEALDQLRNHQDRRDASSLVALYGWEVHPDRGFAAETLKQKVCMA